MYCFGENHRYNIFEDIIDADILSTPEGVTDHSPNVHLTSDYALPHWKCVLRCCSDCLCINIPD